MKRFLLLLLLSVPVFLLAQSAMSLDDCIRLAYKQNPAVRNGVIGIKETKVDYIASVGAFLPHIVLMRKQANDSDVRWILTPMGIPVNLLKRERWDLI